jgi:DNA-directed RNA polymerase subunit RPC12/RpoP
VKIQKNISTTKKVKKVIPSTKDQREARAKASVDEKDCPKSIIITIKYASGVTKYKCIECKKVDTDKSNMNKHVFSHFDEQNYECSLCHKKFKLA